MALSKDELLAKALDEVDSFPNLSQYVRARDPRVLAQLGAQAVMLSMLSEQVDVARFEPFVKARDATVLADASLKGILPLARACKVTLQFTNNGVADVNLNAQRRVMDQKGRLYELDAAVTVPAFDSIAVTATQLRRRSIETTIDKPTDFYRLPVPLSSDEQFLNTISISKGATEFKYAPDWFNVAVDQAAYQVEVDELRRMYVCFGKSTVIGYGVKQGDVFTMNLTECNGRVSDLAPGGKFTLEYVYSEGESGLECELGSVQDEGSGPHSIPELRVMARYSAVYDHNAVYLGEFALLLRRYLGGGIRFLAVWNEAVEEKARGAGLDNINTLFVAGLVSGMTNDAFEARVLPMIKRADSSYRVRFVPASMQAVPVTITASVAINWDRANVEAKIRSLLLENFRDGAVGVSVGGSDPIGRARINTLLRENVDALRDDKAEFKVDITLPGTRLPEHFLHISPASLTVNVSSADYGGSLWNS